MTSNVETGPSLLADFLSKDAQRIWSASWAVIKTREDDILSFLEPRAEDIKKAVDGVELGGAVRLNRDSFKFAMRKLAFHAAKAGCLCELYPEDYGFDPKKEEAAGNVTIDAFKDIPYASEFTCRCTVCGRTYAVLEGEYHFTVWKWSPLPKT